MAGRRPARSTYMSGVYRTAVWSPRRPKSGGDCQTLIKTEGSADVPIDKTRAASISIIAEKWRGSGDCWWRSAAGGTGTAAQAGRLPPPLQEDISEIAAFNESVTHRQRKVAVGSR